jgi:hypothetical protein
MDQKRPLRTRQHFTSSHASAEGYVQNYQGSQLKQNLRYITQHLPRGRADPAVCAYFSPSDWAIIAEVHDWVVQVRQHKRAIIWVRRASPVFDSAGDALLVGSCRRFVDRALAQLAHRGTDGLPVACDVLANEVPAEPEEFCVRLTAPLSLCEASKVEVLESAAARERCCWLLENRHDGGPSCR